MPQLPGRGLRRGPPPLLARPQERRTSPGRAVHVRRHSPRKRPGAHHACAPRRGSMHDRCRSSPDDRPPRVAGAGHALGPRYTAGRDLAVAYLEAGRPAEPARLGPGRSAARSRRPGRSHQHQLLRGDRPGVGRRRRLVVGRAAARRGAGLGCPRGRALGHRGDRHPGRSRCGARARAGCLADSEQASQRAHGR